VGVLAAAVRARAVTLLAGGDDRRALSILILGMGITVRACSRARPGHLARDEIQLD
jgi:hypothetical protein